MGKDFSYVTVYNMCPSVVSKISRILLLSLFLKLTVHSTYTEKSQRNELIKLYTIQHVYVYTSTVNGLMEFAGRNFQSWISKKTR